MTRTDLKNARDENSHHHHRQEVKPLSRTQWLSTFDLFAMSNPGFFFAVFAGMAYELGVGANSASRDFKLHFSNFKPGPAEREGQRMK